MALGKDLFAESQTLDKEMHSAKKVFAESLRSAKTPSSDERHQRRLFAECLLLDTWQSFFL
jgi:hypothetical protein